MPLRYGSVCSGIEAASVAWHPLGWRAAFLAEIEAFPRAVLSHHYPATPLHGNFTTIQAGDYDPIDVLVGGTPCQSFSVAGLRGGLADERGNLALEYLRLADRLRPTWLVWENVPGVLSSVSHDAPDPRSPPDDMEEGSEWVGEDEYDADESHAFACFLAGLQQLGYHGCARVLDAQFFGLAQRRKRVFVVGHLGDWRRAAAVLFEPASLRGDPAPGRGEGAGVAASLTGSLGRRCGVPDGGDTEGQLIAATLEATSGRSRGAGTPPGLIDRTLTNHHGRMDGDTETLIAFDGQNCLPCGEVAATLDSGAAHGNRGVHIAGTLRGHPRPGSNSFGAIAFDTTQITSAINRSSPKHGDPVHPLAAGAHPPAIAFDARQSDVIQYGDIFGPLDTDGHTIGLHARCAVRRLTPRECERLQGFPDDYTLIPYRGRPAADGPRYRALGNSMAVPVMRWIGKRIARQHGA